MGHGGPVTDSRAYGYHSAMTTTLKAARARVAAIRARHVGMRSVAAWRACDSDDRRDVIGEFEEASYEAEGKRRDCYLAAADVLDSAAAPDGLSIPDTLLSDIQWLLTELDERLARER